MLQRTMDPCLRHSTWKLWNLDVSFHRLAWNQRVGSGSKLPAGLGPCVRYPGSIVCTYVPIFTHQIELGLSSCLGAPGLRLSTVQPPIGGEQRHRTPERVVGHGM